MATSINTAEIPVSIVASATAASYTVPSDRYAVVRAQVSDTGSISVNGVLVLGAFSWSAIRANAVASIGTITNYTGTKFLHVPVQVASHTCVGNTGGGANTLALSNIGASSYVALGDQFANSTASETSNHTFKVPAGSTIVGSGSARYLIELYRIPGSAT